LDKLQYQMEELEELTAGFKRQQRVLFVQPAHCRGYSAWSGQLRGVSCGGLEQRLHRSVEPIEQSIQVGALSAAWVLYLLLFPLPGCSFHCSFHCLGALSTALSLLWLVLYPLPGCSIYCLGAPPTAVAGAFHCLGALSTVVAGLSTAWVLFPLLWLVLSTA
jgi:hypothetical protein